MLEGSTSSVARRLWAATLDAGDGALLHGTTTLAWSGLGRGGFEEVHLARPRDAIENPTMLGRCHRLRDLRPEDTCLIRGIPSVTPLRAIWSEASRYSNQRWYQQGLLRIGRLLDDANVRNLVTWDELHRSVDELRTRGRAGTRLMRELAAARPPGTSPTESRNEDRFEQLLAEWDIPHLERQVTVGGARSIGRADFRDPVLPLVVEINSLMFHSSPSDRAADERRYEEMVAGAFTVLVVWEDDLWSHPANVREALREARRAARRGTPRVIHTASVPWLDGAAIGSIPLRRPDLRG